MASETRPVRYVLVCGDKHCRKRAECKLKKRLRKAAERHCPDQDVRIVQTRCLGRCGDGPIVVVHPEEQWFGRVDRQTARAILKRAVRRGKKVKGAHRVKPSSRRLRSYLG